MTMFQLSATVFLFVNLVILGLCSVAKGVLINHLVCEGGKAHLACTHGSKISVTNALYGRQTSSVCTQGPIKTEACAAVSSLAIVRKSCNGRDTCAISASDDVFGEPCNGTFKYLEIQYSCEVPKYLGCYADDRNRVLPDGSKSSDANSVNRCNAYCQTLSPTMKYAGVEYNKQCYCGEKGTTYTRLGKRPESECDLGCTGNKDEFCGGDWRISIYDTETPAYTPPYACEGGKVHLECEKGKTIWVNEATYGRQVSAICRGSGKIKTLNCCASNSLYMVGQRCNGQQICDIGANNNVFGDPCVGTYKYLEVNYECV